MGTSSGHGHENLDFIARDGWRIKGLAEAEFERSDTLPRNEQGKFAVQRWLHC